MFCSKCGKKLQDGSLFCDRCGAKMDVNNDSNAGEQLDSQSAMHPKMMAPSQKAVQEIPYRMPDEKKKLFVVIGMIATIAIVLMSLLLAWNVWKLSNQYSKVCANIDSYNIPDKTAEKNVLASSWDTIFLLNFSDKKNLLSMLQQLEQEAKNDNVTLSSYQSELEAFDQQKKKYDLDKEYANYEKQIEECAAQIQRRDVELAGTALEAVKAELDTLIDKNNQYIDQKIAEYNTADMSTAVHQDEINFKEFEEKVQQQKASNDFAEAGKTLEQMEKIYMKYMQPEHELSINLQQIDVSSYPTIRMYLDILDEYGDVPDGLDSSMFYLRRKNAKGNYIEQNIKKVNQLNHLESLNIEMVADVSGSMEGQPLMEAKNVMQEFVDNVQFHAGDQVELISFSTGVYVEEEFCRDAELLKEDIEYLRTSDKTSLYDALYAAVTRVASEKGAKCVIGFTDGNDNYSLFTAEDVVEIAQRYHVPIFLIGIDSYYYDVEYIAEATGGAYYNVSDIWDMEEIYGEIYRQEKEMYLVEFEDETGSDFNDTINIVTGYHTAEYGGELETSYQPNMLISVDGNSMFGSGPAATVEAYIKSFDDAMTEMDFSYIAPYLKTDSPLYKEQKSYVLRGIEESLDSYEIEKVKYLTKKKCHVSTKEDYFVQKKNEPLKLVVQYCTYEVVKTGGTWKITKMPKIKADYIKY